MDRRQIKTRKSIIKAFDELLIKSNYNSITIQQIIDKANIGRSTFYSHFETKDALLISICTEIFEHIFNSKLPEEIENSSNDLKTNLTLQLSHILFHLKDDGIDIKNILKSESQQIFLSHFRIHIENLFSNYIKKEPTKIPKDFMLNFLVESFISTASWWLISNSQYTPSEISSYYMDIVDNNL